MKKCKTRRNENSASALLPSHPAPRILVVDNDHDIRQLSTEVLIRSGYAAQAAPDDEAAWQALNVHSFDLVITNHKLSKLSGLGLLKKLRAARMALPVILASAMLPRSELRDPSLQPAETLLMPYTVAEFLDKVHKILHTPNAMPRQVRLQ